LAGLAPDFPYQRPRGYIWPVGRDEIFNQRQAPHPLKLDITGTAILVGALSLLVFPLIEGRDLGWPLWSFLMIAASVPALFVFAWWQRVKMAKDGSPLVIPMLFA